MWNALIDLDNTWFIDERCVLSLLLFDLIRELTQDNTLFINPPQEMRRSN